jgi:D-alanyl-D-alanine carboxypeptidase (penicillin-binding protein 5/6)
MKRPRLRNARRIATIAALWIALAAAAEPSPGRGAGQDAGRAAEFFPSGVAAYVVEVEGRTLWSYDPDRALPPASLTKIMTALLFLESGRPLDGVVTVSPSAQRETGSRLRLRAGEQMRARDALAATLLESANDACLALAEHIAGDQRAFTAAMNQRAQQLKMGHTHFSNPCGHDDAKHLSSAGDLARLTAVAMQQPLFAELVRTVELRVFTLGGRRFDLENRNELVGRYPGAIGVKTGFTSRAGKCVVALARRNGVTVLLVALNAPNRWWDSAALLDRAFAEAKSFAKAEK